MKFELKKSDLVPAVLSELTALPPKDYFDEGKLLRHPSDTFIVAYRELLESGVNLCLDYQEALASTYAPDDPSDRDSRLRGALRLFHSRVAEYFEASKKIIDSTKSGKEAGKVNRAFRDATNPFHDQAKKIDNFIKHQQRAIRTVDVRWAEGHLIGYQIEGVLSDGTADAEPQIHRHSGTAFSVNRMVKVYACHIYLVANALKSVLGLPKPTDHNGHPELEKLAGRFLDLVSEVPSFFLPDEQFEPVPLVKKRADNTYLLLYPAALRPDNAARQVYNINFRFIPSHHTNKLIPPYGPHIQRTWEQRLKKR